MPTTANKCAIKDQLSLRKHCLRTIFNANTMICAQNYGAQNMYALKSWARSQEEIWTNTSKQGHEGSCVYIWYRTETTGRGWLTCYSAPQSGALDFPRKFPKHWNRQSCGEQERSFNLCSFGDLIKQSVQCTMAIESLPTIHYFWV